MADMARIKKNVAKMATMNAPEEDIDGYIASEGVTVEDVRNFRDERGGFFSRVGEDIGKRAQFGSEAIAMAKAGQQTETERDLQLAGAAAGGLLDIAGEGVVSLGRGLAATTPEEIKAPLKHAGAAILETEIAQKGLQAIQAGVEKWEEFKTVNPRAARDIESVVNLGAVFTPVKGTSLAGVTVNTAGKTGKAIIATGEKIIKGKKAAAITKNALAQMSSDDLKTLSGLYYKNAEIAGGALKPEFTNKFLSEARQFSKQTAVGKITVGENEVSKLLQRWDEIKDKPLSLSEVQEIDEGLGDLIDGLSPLGYPTKEAKYLIDIQTKFRNMIFEASDTDIIGGKAGFESLAKARTVWSDAMKLRDIEKIIIKAELTDNPAQAMRTGFKNLYTNAKKIKGYTDQERALILKASKTGVAVELLRISGSRLISTIAGLHLGGLPGAAAAQAAGFALRSGANKLQAAPVEELKRTLLQKYIKNGNAP